ncbi:Killer cell lectin-like receptor subfamily E member 1 [Camelus dromedarius]|uniref:Killer cell lectin-like receptor subfamily E member 1 n=2 Tax=Camelus dromedarius TaxID=9838 RepID=A0A5N4C6A9_CAMDR|nr:Killer cell lectin-like receptor subfamily E member 1 [Camelus dromedarius]
MLPENVIEMNEEPIIYTTLNQDSQQRHTPKNNIKPKFGPNELPLTKKKLKHQKSCKRQHKKLAEDVNDKVLSESVSPLPWRWISGVLGVTCLLLMAVTIAVAVFTANSSSEQPPLTVQQEAMESLCLEPCCHSCPKNWVWFRCSCYYFSKEEFTWTESQRACSSLNSSLINMNREEMNFFSLKSFFWIGVYYDGAVKHWLWENNSILSSDMFYLSTLPLQHACLSYKSREVYLAESCETKQTYICKNPLIYPINSQER